MTGGDKATGARNQTSAWSVHSVVLLQSAEKGLRSSWCISPLRAKQVKRFMLLVLCILGILMRGKEFPVVFLLLSGTEMATAKVAGGI